MSCIYIFHVLLVYDTKKHFRPLMYFETRKLKAAFLFLFNYFLHTRLPFSRKLFFPDASFITALCFSKMEVFPYHLSWNCKLK